MKNFLIFGVFCMIQFHVSAQVVTQATNQQSIKDLLQLDSLENIPNVSLLDLPNQEILNLLAEDQVNESNGGPWRFAKLMDADISIGNTGSLQSMGSYWGWAINIKTNSAKSLSVTFKDLILSAGAEIYLFSNEKKVLYGPLTKEMFEQAEEISTEVLPGNSIYVFYRTLKSSEIFDNVHISKIGFGYRDGGSAFNNFGAVEDRTLVCNVDVTGAAGDCFRMEQRAVARTLIDNSTSLCTATLINNTNAQNDLRPFLITANHCSFNQQGNPITFANLGVRFLYYQGNSSIITFIGAAERVATGAISDCSLLEMNQRPNANHGLFYLGWDRTTTPPATSRVLHHPDGDLMKISGDADASITNADPLNWGRFQLPAMRAWRFNTGNNIAGGDFGVTEGGSSGSALINPIHRIVGDLKGGDVQACNGNNGSNANKWYGRFDISYNPPGVPTGNANLRLENWLNPSFNNTQNLNATFQLAGGGNVIPCTQLRQELFAPLLKTSGGTNYTYVWRSSPSITVSGSGSSVLFYANGSCTNCAAWVECDVRNPTACGNQLLATSIRRNFTWGTANDAKFRHSISPPTNNNGSIVGPYNIICAYGTYTINGGLTGIPLPSYIQLNWSSTGPITLYQGTQGCGFTTNAPGFATITCSVLNGQGCLAGYSETFTFEIRYPCSTPFSGGGSESKRSSEPNTTDQYTDHLIQLYPNPANSKVILQFPDGFDVETGVVNLCNQNGSILRVIRPQSSFEEVDLSEFANGVFFISVRDKNFLFNQKLIINKN